MHSPRVTTGTTADASALTGWLREWHAKGRVSDLRAPLLGAERAAHLEHIDAPLPPDYLDLVTQTEGATLAGCVVYGVAEIRKIVCLKANYYLISEIPGLGALAAKEGERNAELYFLHYENNDAQPIGTSFPGAVAGLLRLD